MVLSHYFAMALRTPRRDRLHRALAVLSLSIGLFAFITAYAFVHHLQSFERGFPKAKRAYAVYEALTIKDYGLDLPLAPMTSAVLAENLKIEFPELAAVARANQFDGVASVEGNQSRRSVLAADPTFLDIFDLPFVAGGPRNALAPGNVIVTQKAAQELFGSTEIIGRTITIRGSVDLTVSGVLGPLPEPSQFTNSFLWDAFDLIVPWQTYEALTPPLPPGANPWLMLGGFTYVLLPEDGTFNSSDLNRRLKGFGNRHISQNSASARFEVRHVSHALIDFFQAILLGATVGVMSVSGMLLMLGGVALGISILNYVSLTIAVAARRTREIGIRKALGATGMITACEHLVETATSVLVAFALALLAAQAVLYLLARVGIQLVVPWTDIIVWIVLGTLALGVTLTAAAYTARLLARMHPVTALQAGSPRSGSIRIRAVLLTVQFAAASLLLIALSGIDSENRLLRERSALPMDRTLLAIDANLEDANIDLETLRTELLYSPSILAVTATATSPWSISWGGGRMTADPSRTAPAQVVQIQTVAHDYFDTLGFKVVAGRTFSREFESDRWPASPEEASSRREPTKVVLDRRAAERFGWTNPERAVGQLLYGYGKDSPTSEIIGIVEPKPLTLVALSDAFVYQLQPSRTNTALVAIARDDVERGLADLTATWTRLASGYPLKYQFLDVGFEKSFSLFANVDRVASGLSVLALIIAGTGLFGVASFLVQRRLREIGVRKVHGASTRQILEMLVWGFSKPILLANVVVWPLGWLALRTYFNLFVQRATISPWPFVVSLLVTLAIASIAIATHALGAARLRPVAILRSE